MHSNNPPGGNEHQHDLRSTLTKRQILDGARQVFLMNGFAGASVDQIVAQAGVSKATLYRYFKSKDALFGALISEEAERIARALPAIDSDDLDLDSAVRQIGIAILETLGNPTTVGTLRLIIGALSRFPQAGEEFLRKSLGPTVERIAAYIDDRATARDVYIQDGRAAAGEFAQRCLAQVMERVLMPGQPFMTEAECTAAVDDILRNCSIRRQQASARHAGNACVVGPDDSSA